ncbi:MAG: PaaI family thioesterase [Actinomycetota bacterium]|nr:PaaI family thioesterase [Actinomycetota bacterium]
MQVSDVPHTGLDAAIGLRVVSLAEDRVAARLPITPTLLAPDGKVHHGVLSSAIESIASLAAAAHLGDRGNVVGVSNTTSHFLGVSEGTLDVVAEPVNRLPDRQLWTVRVTDERGELLAQGDVQLANVLDAGQLGT